MDKVSGFIVRCRHAIFLVTVLIALVCALFMPHVNVITDMTTMLPDRSPMKAGIKIMAEEFTGLSMPKTVRVMLTNVREEDRAEILASLEAIPDVMSVTHVNGDPAYEKEDKSLHTLSFDVDYGSTEMKAAEKTVRDLYRKQYSAVIVEDSTVMTSIPIWIIGLALGLLLLILVTMSASYIEPVFFLTAIGLAVLINMGLSYFESGVASITWSIGAILQLALSMDYSMILMNRYRQEKTAGGSLETAMQRAVGSAFPAIVGSSLTTVVGLLALVFMSFKIGADLGIVLARGVFLSMVCIFAVLPELILRFEPLMERTKKKVPAFHFTRLSAFAYRFRKPLLVAFVIFFAAMAVLKGSTQINFTLKPSNAIDPIFPSANQIVVLYNNEDEEKLPELIETLKTEENVRTVQAYANTLGMTLTRDELMTMLEAYIPEMANYRVVVNLLVAQMEQELGSTYTVEQLFSYLVGILDSNATVRSLVGEENLSLLDDYASQIESGKAALVGTNHSMMALTTTFPDESAETTAFLQRLEDLCGKTFKGDWYLIGNSVMAYEMSQSFGSEFNRISWLTAIAIFLVVLFTFRTLAVPLILVLLIQSGVYATMVIINLQGSAIYYLALLIVQGILMGATIDYAILLTSYYRECRKMKDQKTAVAEALAGSSHTIMTSGLIIVVVCAILGYAFGDETILQICHTISKGAATAIVLILFLLPGVLAALDRFTAGKESPKSKI